jgi:predicted PurR-regulated permease PerM
VPDAHVAKVTNILNNANHMLSRYLIGLLIQVSSISILVSLGLSMLGVANAFIIGFFAGLMNVVPYVGPLIGIIVGLVLGITSNLHLEISTELLPLSLKIFSVFMVVQLLDNFLFQPLIFSNSVKSHPLEIFIVVLSAGTLGGIVGLIVAIPLYTIFRIVAKEFLSQYKLIQKITKNL